MHMFVFFFFNDTATTEIYTLSLHDALPISRRHSLSANACGCTNGGSTGPGFGSGVSPGSSWRLACTLSANGRTADSQGGKRTGGSSSSVQRASVRNGGEGQETGMRQFAALLVLIITVSGALRSESAPVPEKLPPGFQNLERKELSNGLKLLIGKPLRPALFSEVLLVVRAGTGTAGSGQEEIARIAAQTLLTARRPQDPSIRVELARLGVSPDFTVGREVAVFRFAVPTVNTHHFLHLLASLLNRRKLPNGVWADAT